jgi:hypothetical protein
MGRSNHEARSNPAAHQEQAFTFTVECPWWPNEPFPRGRKEHGQFLAILKFEELKRQTNDSGLPLYPGCKMQIYYEGMRIIAPTQIIAKEMAEKLKTEYDSAQIYKFEGKTPPTKGDGANNRNGNSKDYTNNNVILPRK